MERRIEVYSPGYLFEGARPETTSAPLVINYDDIFEVGYNITSEPSPEIDSIVLISLPSVAHCYDSNQRYIVLDFEASVNYGYLNVTSPLDRYIAPPGYYMLFLLQKKYQSVSGEVRIPSIAKIVKLFSPRQSLRRFTGTLTQQDATKLKTNGLVQILCLCQSP